MSNPTNKANADWHAVKSPALAADATEPSSASDTTPISHAENEGCVRDDRSRPARWRPFPLKSLPLAIRKFVSEAGGSLVCDPAYVAIPAICLLASAIGNTRRVRLKGGFTQPAVLWCTIVGESGTTKSPAIKAVLNVPFHMEVEAIQAHDRAIADFEEAIQSGKSKGRSNEAEMPSPSRPPPCERRIVMDATVEALSERLETSPRGLLLAMDELSGWIGSLDKYNKGSKGTDAAHYLSMFDASTLIVDRKTGDKRTIAVSMAAVSIVGGVQPKILSGLFTQDLHQNGMVARFFFAMPPTPDVVWTDEEISPEVERAFFNIYKRLIQLEFETFDGDGKKPKLVGLSKDAMAVWIEFFNKHGAEQADLVSDVAAAWPKLRGGAARIALVLHLTRWASGEQVDPDVIDTKSIKDAIAITRWFCDEAKRVHAMLGDSQVQHDYQRHAKKIARKELGVTVRDWRRMRSFPTNAAAETELNEMTVAGYLNKVLFPPTQKGGPSCYRYLAIPEDSDTTPENQAEEEGCVSEEEEGGDET